MDVYRGTGPYYSVKGSKFVFSPTSSVSETVPARRCESIGPFVDVKRRGEVPNWSVRLLSNVRTLNVPNRSSGFCNLFLITFFSVLCL